MLDRTALLKFEGWLLESERILLITHERPDGDAVASVLAMRQALVGLGKSVTCVSRDFVPRPFRFLPGSAAFQTDFFLGEYDLILTFDCGDARRTGFDDRLRLFARTKGRLVNVDHHPKNNLQRLANINLVEFSAAATTQIVYQMFQWFGWPIDHEVATCLLCGLYTDTGGFKHPNTTPEVLEMAADLLGHGGRLKEIIRHLNNPRSISMLRLWGIALDRIRCHHDFGIACSMITLADLAACEADHTDLAGVVNLIKTIPETKIAILFVEQSDGSLRASLRTEADGVDVARLAALFGGGGLKKAGGFTIDARLLREENSWPIVWN